MRTVPKKLNVEIKHCKDPRGHVSVWLEMRDSMGRACCSQAYNYNPETGTWYYPVDRGCVEVTQEHVFRDLVNAYKSLMSIEDLISENLTAAEEGFL